MIADCLLKRFDLIADTQGNIPRLRKLIVDLAVRGRLLKKTSGDMSPHELLKCIAAKRELLIKNGKLRKREPLPPITQDELPASYSAHCVFERLGNVAILEKGLTGIQSATRGEYPLVVTAEARSTCDHFDFDGAAAIIPMVSSSGHGDASLKRLHYQEGKFALGNILCAAFPIAPDLISARFLNEYLTAFKEELLVSKMIGTANVSLTMGKIGDVPVPILPPAVQQRVEELMRLCDALEAAQWKREEVRTRLRTSAMHQLAAPEFDANCAADFILRHLDQYSSTEEDLVSLRQTVLSLSVQGRLVPQEVKDGNAKDLFNSVAAEKARLLKSRLIKEESRLDPISSNEHLFLIPDSWIWCRAGDVCYPISSGSTPAQDVFHASDGAPFLKVYNIRNQVVDFDYKRQFIDMEHHKTRMKRSRLFPGDVIMNIVGPPLGKTAIVTATFPEWNCNQAIAFFRPIFPEAAAYLYLFLKEGSFLRNIQLIGSVGQDNISVTKCKNIAIPLPPLAEQRRIVAKVDELMAVLDALEATLTTARTASEQLLAATIAKLHAA